MRSSLKFLHLADLHLDRALSAGKLKLPFEKAVQRQRELRDAFGRGLELAKSEGVEVILIAGDLWEEEELTPETIQFVLERLGQVGIPVIIAPGNHDFYSPAGHYSSDITMARFGKAWPSNVFIFREYELVTVGAYCNTPLPGLEDVAITGLAYHSNLPVQSRKLAERVPRAQASIHLAVIHGSRDDNLPPGKMRTLPFSDAELLAQPFDYTALGHYHISTRITDSNGKVRAAYTGSMASLSVEDEGERGCLIGTVRAGGVAPDELKFVELDRRRLRRLKLDISGLAHVHAVEERIEANAREAGVRPEDMLFVELFGSYPQGSRISFGDDFIRDLCWHVRIETGALFPEWDMTAREDLNPRTTEALFRSRIHKLIEEASARGDEAEAKRLQNAMFYGLDALYGRPVAARRS